MVMRYLQSYCELPKKLYINIIVRIKMLKKYIRKIKDVNCRISG